MAAELQVRREGENRRVAGVGRMRREMRRMPTLHREDLDEKAVHNTAAA